MSFANYLGFDPPLDLMLHGQHNGIPPMFACFDYKAAECVPEGRDCVVIVGTRNRSALANHIAKRARKAVVIVCPGDKAFINAGKSLPNNIVRVFTTNQLHADSRVTGTPLGVKSSALQLLRFARRHRLDRDHRARSMLYLNFSTGGDYEVLAKRRNITSRKVIAERFQSETWVTHRVATQAASGQEALFRYFNELMRHKFVASPEGYGIDCHRHWESLYLGAIPIVQRSEHMQNFSDLPILYTDDYSEIKESYLHEVYEDFSSRTYDFSKLYAPYYTNILMDAVSELEDPAFLLLLSDEDIGWAAQNYLHTLSRCNSPYGANVKAGNLVPTNPRERGEWRVAGGATLSFGSDESVIVEHADQPELVGAWLRLEPVKGIAYRAYGEIRSMDQTSYLPKLELIAPQGKQVTSEHVVLGYATLEEGAKKFDFTFSANKVGTSLQFRPGGRAMLNIRVEPVVD